MSLSSKKNSFKHKNILLQKYLDKSILRFSIKAVKKRPKRVFILNEHNLVIRKEELTKR